MFKSRTQAKTNLNKNKSLLGKICSKNPKTKLLSHNLISLCMLQLKPLTKSLSSLILKGAFLSYFDFFSFKVSPFLKQ